MKLTVVTHTRNSSGFLPRLLETTDWADERIVVDMASTDNTVQLAKQAGCRVFEVESHPRVDGIRNKFIDHASNQWVFVLDSDEYLAQDAKEEISKLIANCDRDIDAFSIPRFNYLGSQLLNGSGWYPDHQIRLFKKGAVRWSDSIHQPPNIVRGNEALRILQTPGCLHIHHNNYDSLEEFILKQLEYALSDIYSENVETFNFNDYLCEAYEQFTRRNQPNIDGDLSTALATVMAWDSVTRGLIHWSRLGRPSGLIRDYSLPITSTSTNDLEVELAQVKRELENAEMKAEQMEAQVKRELENAEMKVEQLEALKEELVAIQSSNVWKSFRFFADRYPRKVAFLGKIVQSFRNIFSGKKC